MRLWSRMSGSPGVRVLLAGLLLAGVSVTVSAQAVAAGPAPVAAVPEKMAEPSIAEWLMRMHEGSRKRSYIGVFVVSSGNTMSSSRIWHVCDGDQQVERVEALSGAPRSTFRHNDRVVTFLPESKTALIERRESLGVFPDLLKSADSSIARFYTAKRLGTAERVAGLDAELVVLKPKDGLRYGYRIWTEKASGLVVKLQTLDADGSVLEQAAFSELQLDAPVQMAKLTHMMGQTQGYKVHTEELQKTTPQAEGWEMKDPVAGFEPMSCHLRPPPRATATAAPEGAARGTVQWVFSDGLATVSLFVEPFDPARHTQEAMGQMGATRMMTRRISDKGGSWWLTAVGEVPQRTLAAFAQGLVRSR